MTKRTFQSGLGTKWERAYKEGTNISTILFAQVTKVNHKYNTVDLVIAGNKDTFESSYTTSGKLSARLPLEFGGRNSAGQAYGQVQPINVGDTVLVGFVQDNKLAPVVLGVYGSSDVNAQLARTPFDNADPKDESLVRQTNQKFSLYPSLTYDNIDGEGNRTVTFTGKTFFTAEANDNELSGLTDGNHGTEYSELDTSYYANGEEIEPMSPYAPSMLMKHQGILTQSGEEDRHLTLIHLKDDGAYRISQMDKADDWRSYFEMLPDGSIKLRKQFDSKIIGQALESAEIGLDADGTVFLRSGETFLELKSDGIYSNGLNLDVDLTEIQEQINEHDKRLVILSMNVETTAEALTVIANRTEIMEGELTDFNATLTIMAQEISTKVSETQVQDIVDGALEGITSEIDTIREDNERLSGLLNDIADDGMVTPLEKQTLLREWEIIQDEYPTYLLQAEEYEISTTVYKGAYEALGAYLSPLFTNMDETSSVVPSTLKSKFKAYYDERLNLLIAVLTAIKKIAVEAMKLAGEAMLDAGEAWREASKAVISANTANELIADIASDGKLTPSEKYELKREYDAIIQEYPTVIAQADKYSVSTVAYTQRFDALKAFVVSNALFNNMQETIPVSGEELRQVFASYYVEKVKLLRSVTDEARVIMEDHDGRISLAETNITQTAQAITLLASTVETLEGTVEANTAQIEINAKAITERVTRTELHKEIEDLTIGGGNGLKNTGLAVDTTHWEDWGTDSEGTRERVEVTGLPSLTQGFKIVKGGNTNYGYIQRNVTILPETTYTISAWARVTAGTGTVTIGKGRGVDEQVLTRKTVGTKWLRVVYTWKTGAEVTSTDYFVGIGASDVGQIIVAGMKLEEGSKATSWTAHPSDINAEIKDELAKNPVGGANYVGFSSGNEEYPRLMIKNVGYYTTQRAITAFKDDKVEMTPESSGVTGVYVVGTTDISIANVGLEAYGITATQDGDYLTASADILTTGAGARLAIDMLDNDQWVTYYSDVVPANGRTKRAVALGKITMYTKGVAIRIIGEAGFTKVTFSKVQLETGMQSTAWKKATTDLEHDIDNVVTMTQNQYTVILSNESATIPTDKDGANGDFTTAKTELFIYQLGKDDTANWTVTAVPSAGVLGNLIEKRYEVSAMNSNTGFVTFTAKKGIYTLTKTFNLAKAKAGVSGSSAQLLTLSTSSNTVIITPQGVPESNTIRFSANLKNITGNPTFTATPYINDVKQADVTLAGSGVTRTFATSSWNVAWTRMQVVAKLGTLEDTQTIVRLVDGKDGATGVGIKTIQEYYAVSTSNTTPPTTWSVDVPTMTETNKYLWNYEKITYTDNTFTDTKAKVIGVYGTTGVDGVGITGVQNYYLAYTSNTGVTEGTAGWTTTPQVTTASKRYLWNYEVISYTKGSPTKTTPSVIGTYGDKGDKGDKGDTNITALLTNESITLSADSSGNTSDYTEAKGSMVVYDGITKVTTGVTYSVVNPSKIVVAITQTGDYSITSMSAGMANLTGSATIRAVYKGVTIDKTLSVTKTPTGSKGDSATSYWLNTSDNIIGKSQTGVLSPSTLKVEAYSKTGTANSALYAGRFIIQTSTNGTSYTTRYTSSANQNAYTYTIPTDTKFIKALLYQAGGTTVLLDEQTVPVVESAEGIEIGQRNYILNSKVYNRFHSNNGTLYPLQLGTDSIGNWITGHHIDAPSTYFFSIFQPVLSDLTAFSPDAAILEGDEVTLSAEFMSSEPIRVRITGGEPTKVLPNKWTKIYGASKSTNRAPMLQSDGNSGISSTTKLYHRNWKLEKGNVATDWSPAPEDARTYKAWANSADGGADFTRVYPNENLLVVATSVENKGLTWATSANYAVAGGLQSDYIPVKVGNYLISTHRADIAQTFTYNKDKDYIKSGYGLLDGWKIPNDASVDPALSNAPTNGYPTDKKPAFVRLCWKAGWLTTNNKKDIKVEQSLVNLPTIYTTNPKDSLTGSVPKYIGMSPVDSNKPEDYAWMINPEWAEAKSDEGLNGKEGAILKQPNAPTNPAVGLIWVDTTSVPNVPKRWTGTEWVKLTATEASEIGAFTESEGTELVERMNTAENIITADSITSTVLSSEDFTTLFDGKANAEDLEGMATISGVDDLLQTWSAQMKSDLGDTYNPLFTRYTELKETIDKFDFKISQAGGINMLQNSLGFSGLDFWEDTTAPGINILEGSYGDMREVTVQGWGDYRDPLIRNGNSLLGDYIQIGKTYTLSVRLTTGAYSARCFIRMPKEGEPYRDFRGNDIPPNSTGISKVTFTVPEDALSAYVFSIRFDLSTTPAHTMSHGGFKLEEGSVATAWTPAPLEAPGFTGGGLTTTTQDNALASLGFGSGFVNQASGAKAIQRVELPSAGMYTLSFYMKKVTTNGGSVLPVGTGGIELYLGGEKHIFIGAEKGVEVETFEKYSYTFTTEILDLEVHMVATDNEDTEVTISGIMLNIGDLALLWQPYPSEIYNTNVLVDINGITVKNNQTDGYTIITPKEFSGYANVDGNMRRIFTLNGATTEVEELEIRSKLKMGVLTVIPVTTTKNKGWAFI